MTETQTAARTDWSAVWLLVLAGVVSAAQIGKVPPAIPTLRTDLGLTLPGASWVISALSLVGAATGVALGALGDRFGHRNVICLGLVVTALGSAIGAVATGLPLLLGSRLLEGLGFMATVVSVPALLVRIVRQEDRGLVFGIWGGYMPAGTALMIAIAPALLVSLSWRGMWLANAALLIVCAVALFVGARQYRSPAHHRGTHSMGSSVRQTVMARGPLLLAANFALYTSIFLTVFGFLPVLLIDDLGFSLTSAAAWTAVAVAVNIIGNLAGGLGLQVGIRRWLLITVAFVVMGVSAIFIYQSGMPAAVRLTAAIVLSAVGGAIPAVCIAGSAVHAPTRALIATTNGLIMQASQLGQTIGPVVTAAVVAAVGGWQVAPLLLVATAAVGLGLAQIVRRAEAAM